MTAIKKVFSWREAVYLSDLKPTTRFVLFYLSQRMDTDGRNCFPSVTTIAQHTGLSKRAIFSNVQLAIDSGFLVKRHIQKPGQKWKHSIYYPATPAHFELVRATDYPPDEGDELGSVVKSTTAASSSEGVQEVQTTSPVTSPKDIDKKINKKNKPKMVTIEEWEKISGRLDLHSVKSWVVNHHFDQRAIAELIEEFRVEMGSKGKLYADFRLAFMTYLTKGYLSKKKEQIPARAAAGVQQTTRGHSL